MHINYVFSTARTYVLPVMNDYDLSPFPLVGADGDPNYSLLISLYVIPGYHIGVLFHGWRIMDGDVFIRNLNKAILVCTLHLLFPHLHLHEL